MIIDFHTHTFPDAVAPKAIGKLAAASGIAPFTDGTVSGTLESMKRTGVDLCVCLNIATRPGQEPTINRTAADICKQYKGRLIAFGSVHPDSPDALEEVDRIAARGLPGIKLHPDYQNFTVDDARLDPLYARIAAHGLILVLHAGWDCYSPTQIHCPPENAARVAKRFPQLTVVLAHFGGLRMWEDVYTHLAGLPNVFFDTSMAATEGLPPALAMRILDKHPPENVVLGSDCPWEDPRRSIAYVQRLPLSEERMEAILGANACRLLHIPQTPQEPA